MTLPNVDNASVSPRAFRLRICSASNTFPAEADITRDSAELPPRADINGAFAEVSSGDAAGGREGSMKQMKFLQTIFLGEICQLAKLDTYYISLQPSVTAIIYMFLKVSQSNSHNSSSQLPCRPSVIDLTNALFEHDRCDRNKNVFQG